MENVLISACLLGVACRYDGLSKPIDKETICRLQEKYHLIPVCPEIMGGLSTPRIPSEVGANRLVKRKDGIDVTAEYEKGANEVLHLAKMFGCKLAILKARSPACGSGVIYDGSFTGKKTVGDGIAADILKKSGICVLTEEELYENLLTNA